MSDIKELNDEELEKVSGGDHVYDENGNLLYYSGYYLPNILFFCDAKTNREFLKNEKTNQMIEVIDADFDSALAAIGWVI